MRWRGFTFIELLISSAILAGVLIMAFTVYAVINRNGRSAQRLRANSTDGATLVNLIADYGRYASPWLDENDDPVCRVGNSPGINADQLEALRTGVAVSSDHKTFLVATRESDVIGTVNGYVLNSFTFTLSGTGYIPTFSTKKITKNISGVCEAGPPTSGISLLPNGLLVVPYYAVLSSANGFNPQPVGMVGVQNQADSLIAIRVAQTVLGGTIGSYSPPISLEASPNRLPHVVDVKFGVINSAYPNQPTFEYVTSFTPRDYASEFVAL